MEKETRIRWKETHTIATYEVDFTNRLRISSIFDLMQEAAANNANHLGWGYDHLEKDNLFWVLSRVRLILKEHKRVGEQIIIETWPKKIESLFAVRDFKILDGEQNIVGLATTCWLLLNNRTMRPLKPADLLRRVFQHDPESAIDEIPGKISDAGEKELIYEKQIRYRDIDVNRHVNNVRHVECILDCFPVDQYEGKKIASVQVNYIDEIKYGDTLLLYRARAEDNRDRNYIEGVNRASKKIFQALIDWK